MPLTDLDQESQDHLIIPNSLVAILLPGALVLTPAMGITTQDPQFTLRAVRFGSLQGITGVLWLVSS